MSDLLADVGTQPSTFLREKPCPRILLIWKFGRKAGFPRLNFIAQIMLVVRMDSELIGLESRVNSEVIPEREYHLSNSGGNHLSMNDSVLHS